MSRFNPLLLFVSLLSLLCAANQTKAQSCGSEGQSACAFWIRIPSCNELLVERAGRCVHPPCGREGERPCLITERLPSCDRDLIERAGRCVRPSPCGGDGQRACRVWERVPSCNPYLVEAAGSCMHPPCGREGERACTVFQRVPSCDINLAEVAGICSQPSPCGGEGQRECRLWEFFPSCRSNELVARDGRCVHPDCGRLNNVACTVVQRIPSCDQGLIEINGHCSAPTPCGNQGERECNFWEHFPSCRSNELVAREGHCVHPDCGRLNDVACSVVQRVPSCDQGLIETNGHCNLPTPCGDDSQRECNLWEHFPSCRSNELVAREGRCVHPDCGRLNDVACSIVQRIPSCDQGLIETNGHCSPPTPCGDQGQRECNLWEHIPSCRHPDLRAAAGICIRPDCGDEGKRECNVLEHFPSCRSQNLVAREGRCVHPDCGREHERPCIVTERLPSCDDDLIERLGSCVPANCGAPATPACNVFERLYACDVGSVEMHGVCIRRTACGSIGQRACTLAERGLLGTPCAQGLTEVAGCSGECFGSSGVCADLQAAIEEPSTNSSPLTATDPMRGFADLHVHMFSHLGSGGAVVTGRPYSRAGVADALKSDFASELDLVGVDDAELPQVSCPDSVPDCGNVLLHGDHVGPFDDTIGFVTGDSSTTHFGAPVFNGWPTWRTTTHQQVYYKWLERAWRGGMRLMVLLAMHNEALCWLSKRTRGVDCADSMLAIDHQLEAAREFEHWLNEQPGGGWFEIVDSPDHAERAIRQGKLAVVLGIEVDSLFNCKANAPCSREYLRSEIARYRDQFSVRHIYPTHNFDNGMVGTAVWMDFLNVGNRIIEQRWYDVEPCSSSDFVPSTSLVNAGIGFAVNAVLNAREQTNNNLPYPAYPRVPVCNTRGVSETGTALIDELMKAGMMIDVDHMSSHSVAETLKMASERGGYPVSVGHGAFAELYEGERKRHEGMKTAGELAAIRELGGIVSAITTADLQGSVSTVRLGGNELPACRLSSTSFAQSYLYAARAMGDAVAFGSDFNGLAPHVAPRFGDSACGGDTLQWAAQQQAPRLSYPFTLPGFGVFERQVTGQRTFDFNVDGLAHIGMLPDLIADMMTLGLTEAELDPLMNSARAYVEAWRRAEGLSETTSR